jgi:hypothetical protein
MQQPDSNEPQVSKQEIEEFLKQGTPASQLEQQEIPVDLPEDLRGVVTGDTSVTGDWGEGFDAQPEAPAAQDDNRVKLEPDQEFATKATTQELIYNWTLMDESVGQVQVNDLEKSIYLKAALSESPTPVVWDVDLPSVKKTMRLRDLTPYEKDVLFTALRRDADEGPGRKIFDAAQWTSFLQYYSAAMRVLAIDGRPRETLAYAGEAAWDYSKVFTDAEHLRTNGLRWAMGLPAPFWSLVARALVIYEAKYTICTQGLLNKDFWEPADTV